MKKRLRILAIAVGAALAVAAGAVGLSRAVYGRSLKATVYEHVLRGRFATDRTAESEIERLEARRAAGETPYAIPEGLDLRAEVVETERAGMQVFTMPAEAMDAPIVLYLHGGAYINPFNAYQWRFMDRLARETGCEVVAPAYHLAPFADYARAYDDLSGLYRDLTDANPGRRVILMGDSAGGGLALGLGEYLVGRGEALPERLVLFSPWVDVTMDNPDIGKYVSAEPILHLELVKVHGRYWAGNGDTRDWRVSPLFGEMAGLPPVTVYYGDREILCPDIALACDKLRAAGVDADIRLKRGMNHDWPLMPLPEAEAAFREIAALVRGDLRVG